MEETHQRNVVQSTELLKDISLVRFPKKRRRQGNAYTRDEPFVREVQKTTKIQKSYHLFPKAAARIGKNRGGFSPSNPFSLLPTSVPCYSFVHEGDRREMDPAGSAVVCI